MGENKSCWRSETAALPYWCIWSSRYFVDWPRLSQTAFKCRFLPNSNSIIDVPSLIPHLNEREVRMCLRAASSKVSPHPCCHIKQKKTFVVGLYCPVNKIFSIPLPVEFKMILNNYIHNFSFVEFHTLLLGLEGGKKGSVWQRELKTTNIWKMDAFNWVFMIYNDTSDHSVICTPVQRWMKVVDVAWRCDSFLPNKKAWSCQPQSTLMISVRQPVCNVMLMDHLSA